MAIKELVEVLTRQRGDGRNAVVTWDDTGELLNAPVLDDPPTAPTAAPGTSTQQIATTEFVTKAIFEAVRDLRAEMDTD